MDHIIRLHSDPHSDAEALMPWYVSGQLDAAERAQIETHLADCAACRAELALERRLRAEVAELSLEADLGWDRLRDRIDAAAAPDRGARLSAARFGQTVVRPRNLALFFGAQAAVLGLAVVLLQPKTPEAPYHALGAAPVAQNGNLIVLFRPDATEAKMRGTLAAVHARLVDGPTPAGAYVLHIAPAERASALAALQAREDVVLAQPIDASPQP